VSYQSEYIEGKIKSTFVCHQTNKIKIFLVSPTQWRLKNKMYDVNIPFYRFWKGLKKSMFWVVFVVEKFIIRYCNGPVLLVNYFFLNIFAKIQRNILKKYNVIKKKTKQECYLIFCFLSKRLSYFDRTLDYIVRSFKFILKVGVEESIVNALYGLRITDQLFKSYVLHEWCLHNRLFNANFEDKFKWTHDTCYTRSFYWLVRR
jgi:hypothetical protein